MNELEYEISATIDGLVRRKVSACHERWKSSVKVLTEHCRKREAYVRWLEEQLRKHYNGVDLREQWGNDKNPNRVIVPDYIKKGGQL